MNVNSNLNMLIDCSDDNYINLYSLPNFKIIRVIYNNNIEKFFFLLHQFLLLLLIIIKYYVVIVLMEKN